MSSYIYENKTYKFIYLDAVSFTNENTKKRVQFSVSVGGGERWHCWELRVAIVDKESDDKR